MSQRVVHMWLQGVGNGEEGTSVCTCGYGVAERVRGVSWSPYVVMGCREEEGSTI